jgi:hypothetical protein
VRHRSCGVSMGYVFSRLARSIVALVVNLSKVVIRLF